jgi:hypothetical protein
MAPTRWNTIPPQRRNRIERAIGRWLAVCLHPVAAWRVLTDRWRWLIAATYFAAAYLSVFCALALSAWFAP